MGPYHSDKMDNEEKEGESGEVDSSSGEESSSPVVARPRCLPRSNQKVLTSKIPRAPHQIPRTPLPRAPRQISRTPLERAAHE